MLLQLKKSLYNFANLANDYGYISIGNDLINYLDKDNELTKKMKISDLFASRFVISFSFLELTKEQKYILEMINSFIDLFEGYDVPMLKQQFVKYKQELEKVCL